MAKGYVPDLPKRAIADLGLSPSVKDALLAVQSELTSAYQKNFVEMVQVIRQQASALERVQMTLNILIEHIAPQIKDRIPVALRVATSGETPDLASALVITDPIAAGYTMTQATLAHGLGLSQADVSILVRAFKLVEDGECAVVVRRGTGHQMVNYHPRAVERFRARVATPPAGLTAAEKSALARVTKRLVLAADKLPGADRSSAP